MPTYRVIEGSLQDGFLKSRAKIQFYGGGFANGKTSGACIKLLRIAKDYPGSNGLVCRETYPKLRDSIQREFMKWCPDSWIASNNQSTNTLILKNGSVINFRHIVQEGKRAEATTSNLLSANYDWVCVDQVEDPGITEKDFFDLLGRLRGTTEYRPNGDPDPTMPLNGPRWMILTSNPTANWVYTKLIKPLHDHKLGRINTDLMLDNSGVPIIELFEGSTYANKENIPEDYIATLEATYKGVMRERFLEGKWGAYEGLVYPDFSITEHVVEHNQVAVYLRKLQNSGKVTYVEGYDHGIAQPACYLFGFVDHLGNVILCDGFYDAEQRIDTSAEKIKSIRKQYRVLNRETTLFADPACFKRTSQVGADTVADMFGIAGIDMYKGENGIDAGIARIQQRLVLVNNHLNPFTKTHGAPYLFVSDKLQFLINEIGQYRWNKDASGNRIDQPVGKDDHSMDALKYLLTQQPEFSTLTKIKKPVDSAIYKWNVQPMQQVTGNARYA